MTKFKVKVNKNKANSQLSIFLPLNKLKKFKKKTPKALVLKIDDIIW